MSTTTTVISWLDIIRRADPEFNRTKRYVVEYEFSAPGGRMGDERTHEGGSRVFRGNYDERGPYAPETVGSNDLTFGGIPLEFDGERLTFGDD